MLGNRITVPLSREVMTAIEGALEASIVVTSSPAATKQFGPTLKTFAAFLKEAEKAIRQTEKTATAAIKALGVLGVLAAAIGSAAWKLYQLIGALG